MSGRRRAQSSSKTYKEYAEAANEPSPPSNKHPRIDVETLKLDDPSPPNTTTSHDHPSLESNGRTPSSSKLRMIGNYCVERTIGRGQFGKVKLAYHKKLPDMKVAIKIINKTKLDEDTLKMIQREVHIMKNLQHPNIIRLYEVLETPRTLYLIMEYAEGGEVMDFIIAHGKIPEREAKRFFAQMLSAVQYCHSKKCCHRDLKPENLLLDSNMNVKIIDFGLSNMFLPGSLMKTFCGSPTYASPELILRKEYLGPPVDVWSMGVVLFVLVCGYLPFDGHNFVDLFNKILKAQYTIPSHVSESCTNLLERMLVVDPEHRATTDEIRKHPWLSSVQDCLPDVTTIEITDETKMNPAVLDELAILGFHKDEVIQSVLKSTFSDAAAMYFLLDARRHTHRRPSYTAGPTTPMTSAPSFNSPAAITSTTTTSTSNDSPPNSPYVLPHSKSAKNHDEVKRVGFNIQPTSHKRDEAKEGGGGGGGTPAREGRSSAHRRAASEAMKEQVLKQAKAQHEALKLAQYSTPQAKPINFKEEREPHTPNLQPPHHHIGSTPVRHSMAVGAGWNTPPLDLSKTQNNNHENEEDTVPPSPSSKMSSIISSFKSMWKKDKTSKSGDQPRVVRFAFHVNTMTDKSPDVIVAEIQHILKECNVSYTMKGNFCANCLMDNVRFSIEVCRLPRLLVNGVRFSRISGSAWKYKTIVKDLVVHMKL